MSPKTKRVLLLAVIGIAFVSGYALGTQRMFRWMMDALSNETQGNLAQRVETLARLRTGDREGAIAQLEQSVDTAVMTLPQEKRWTELSESVQRALMVAKAYRSAFPAVNPHPDLVAKLSEVPLPERQYCSPALLKVMELAEVQGAVGGRDGI